mgnify:CR=1 FL=1|jgi:hypothetical protein
MKTLRLAVAAALLPLTLACTASTWQVVPRPDVDAPIPPGHARVVVVREFGFVGGLREVRILDEGREIGVIGPSGYLVWDRVADRGVGRAIFSGYVLDGGEVENVFDMPREAGSTTWAVLRLRSGDRKPVAEAVSDKEGRELIASRDPAEVREPD